jgi:hypothetical protein
MCGKKSKRGIELLAAAWMLLVSMPACAADWTLNGSYKAFLDWIYNADLDGGSSGISDNILRLDAGFHPADQFSAELAYVLYPEIVAPSLGTQGALFLSTSSEYRVGDPPRRLLPLSKENMDNIGLYQDIDRAVMTLHLPFADVSAGRQAISWGSAHVVNPTDVLVPFRFLSLDTEYRKGVDAVRIRLPLSDMDEISAGYVAGKDFLFDESAFFGRTHLYLLETDLDLTGMIFKKNLLLGWDMARALGGAGVWLETAWVMPEAVQAPDDPLRKSYVRISVGADYNFTADFYGYAEYHFNSAGKNNPRDYLDIILNPDDHPAYSQGNVYLLGMHYLSLGGTYTKLPLIPISFLLMVNLNDLSADFSVSADYNIKENIYIEGGFFVGLGPGPSLQDGQPTRYRSEFGAYPDAFYTAVKVYF